MIIIYEDGSATRLYKPILHLESILDSFKSGDPSSEGSTTSVYGDVGTWKLDKDSITLHTHGSNAWTEQLTIASKDTLNVVGSELYYERLKSPFRWTSATLRKKDPEANAPDHAGINESLGFVHVAMTSSGNLSKAKKALSRAGIECMDSATNHAASIEVRGYALDRAVIVLTDDARKRGYDIW